MTITTKNIEVRLKFAELIKAQMGTDEVKRYKKEFRYKAARTIYEHGNLDVYDYDLFLRLEQYGVNTKPVTEYSKVLDDGCTYKHREDIRNEYIKAIKYALPYVN